MGLNTQAMLANLNISQWTARKHDRKATIEVDQAHGAKGAGRYNKLLIDAAALEPINKCVTALRDHHYKVTLPWGDNGDRLLPSKLYLQYTQAMHKLKIAFDQQVSNFVRDYPQLVQDARLRLGTLYEPKDYPLITEIQSRFSVSFSFTPVPDANDFRVDVADADAKRIKADIVEMVRQRQEQAMKDAFERAREVVLRVRDRCSAEKPVIRDTLMSNVEELVEMLPAFNLTGDSSIDALAFDLRGLLKSTAVLRNSPEAREATAKTAGDIAARMGWS